MNDMRNLQALEAEGVGCDGEAQVRNLRTQAKVDVLYADAFLRTARTSGCADVAGAAKVARMTLPVQYLRCQGRTARILGQAVLASECLKCARRTSERPDGVMFLQTPTGWPCQMRVDEDDAAEVYGE